MRTIARRTSKIDGRRTTDGKSLVDGDDTDGTPHREDFPTRHVPSHICNLSARHSSSHICHKFRYRSSPPVCTKYVVSRLSAPGKN